MKSFILVALCWLSIKLASAHPAVPCHGTTYFDCYHYCYGSCRGLECFHRCQSGCGCEEAFIVRNNGACWKVEVCQVGDDDEDPGDAHDGKRRKKVEPPMLSEAGLPPEPKKAKNNFVRQMPSEYDLDIGDGNNFGDGNAIGDGDHNGDPNGDYNGDYNGNEYYSESVRDIDSAGFPELSDDYSY
ncbi:uncharacterized protein LOC6601596 [Drosophila persimilis]|uniref:uncharacterized protein LOC6601596 n=1 Tax=Drosophila persimilis TaxID=7234 RepID=UPI000F0833B3|nr:uncharacterized protein LOC6601596 [Drosophila persimilis]